MKRSSLLVLVVSIAGLFALAQDGAATQVNSARHAELGSHLVDGEGMSLYLFANDSEGASTCEGGCAEAWPPLLADGEVTAGSGVAASLITTFERADGGMQVAYNGHPLYLFAQDEAPGDVKGHGVNDVWFLVSPFGAAVEVPEPEEEDASESSRGDEMDPMAMADLMGAGRNVFLANCTECHASDGEGLRGPSLRNNARLGDDERVIGQILRGGSHMPGFQNQLDDEQVAALVTFIRNTWGNDFGPVTAEEVKRER